MAGKYLYTKDYEDVLVDEYSRQPTQFSQILKISAENELRQIKKGEMATFGAMSEVGRGGATPYQDYTDGNEKEILFQTYKTGFQISEEDRDDDLKGVYMGVSKELGKSARYTEELIGFDVLNSGFVTTKRTGLDGLALFSSAHTYIVGSGTQSNLGATSLNKTALESAVTSFRKLKNKRGIPVVMTPDLLVIPPELEWKAKELLLTPYDPESANNAINTMYNEMKYLVVNFLTSTTAWFLFSSMDHDLHYIRRKPLSFQDSSDFDTDAELYKVTMRVTSNFWNWEGAWGSPGV